MHMHRLQRSGHAPVKPFAEGRKFTGYARELFIFSGTALVLSSWIVLVLKVGLMCSVFFAGANKMARKIP